MLVLEVYVELFVGNYPKFENFFKNSRRVKRVKLEKGELIVIMKILKTGGSSEKKTKSILVRFDNFDHRTFLV